MSVINPCKLPPLNQIWVNLADVICTSPKLCARQLLRRRTTNFCLGSCVGRCGQAVTPRNIRDLGRGKLQEYSKRVFFALGLLARTDLGPRKRRYHLHLRPRPPTFFFFGAGSGVQRRPESDKRKAHSDSRTTTPRGLIQGSP